MNITSPAVKITAGNRVFLNMSTQQKVLRASQFMTMSTAAREADPGPSYNIRDASPFAILDTIYHAENFMKKRVNPNLIFPPMVVAFNTSNSPSTSWTSSLKQLNVNGNINKDSDEYDRVIILHEWLHYFQELFLRSDTTSGGHSSGEHVDPTLAFNEAISTSFGAIMNESNWYVDTSANGSHGGGAGCIVHAGGAADTDTCSNVEKDGVIKDDSGSFCEDCSIEMIWDLFDSSDPGNAAGKPLDPDTDGFIAVDMPTDLIELDFKKITDAALMIKPKRAFNTIVSYLNDVRSLLPFGAAENIGILDLAKGEGINLTVGDTYEPSGDRLYNVITVGTPLANFNTQAHEGEILKTLDENDISCNACEGNKFGEFIYFKFTVPPGGAGKYAVSIIPADRSWIMGCELIGSDATKTFYNRKDGTIFPYNGIGGTFPTGILSFQTPILSEGDTFLRVNSAVARPSGVRSGKTSVWPFTYAPATFSILVEKAP